MLEWLSMGDAGCFHAADFRRPCAPQSPMMGPTTCSELSTQTLVPDPHVPRDRQILGQSVAQRAVPLYGDPFTERRLR